MLAAAAPAHEKGAPRPDPRRVPWGETARVMDHCDDRALLTRMSHGDQAAFAFFYDRYAAAAYSVAVSLVGETEEAAAAVEDAFLRVWRTPQRWERVEGALPLALLVTQAVSDARRPSPSRPKARSTPS